MYSKLEEDFGLSRHAMAVYERAAKAVPKEEKYEVSLRFYYSLLTFSFVVPIFFISQKRAFLTFFLGIAKWSK